MRIALLALLIFSTVVAQSQIKERALISADGFQGVTGNLFIESSLGEITSGYYHVNGFHFLVGFHQPNMVSLDETTDLPTLVKKFELRAYPNPTRDFINISMDETLQFNLRNIIVTDLRGVLVNNFSGNELKVIPITISLADLHPGIYFMQLVFDEGKNEIIKVSLIK